jgi:eukaryotic-like serine/threonine-protein kinase
MKFRIENEVGRGGFCMVHKCAAMDENGNEVGEVMAIKRIRDDLNEPEEVMAEIRTRFEREARLLDEVLDHENIVLVLHRNLTGEEPFFIMPLADGNVWDEIEERAGDEEWACAVFRQMLDGMVYAHGKGVIHRDLKPENGLIFDGKVQLSDLGLGKNLESGTVGLTKTMSGVGTEAYMAPEQFTEMKDTLPAADVFALGKLLIALLTGEHPLVGTPDVSDLPEKYRYFVSRCCEGKPENRYADARRAQEAFARIDRSPDVEDVGSELEELVEAWFSRPEGEDLDVVEEIDRLLREHPGEESLYTKQVPRLPADLANQYMDELPDAFAGMLSVYDNHVSGGLPYEYCDTVADFYSGVFLRTDRIDVRKLVVSRLISLGSTHHRYHVRKRLLRVLSQLDEANDASTIAMVVDVIDGNEHAVFTAEIAQNWDLPSAIRRAFREAGEDS